MEAWYPSTESGLAICSSTVLGSNGGLACVVVLGSGFKDWSGSSITVATSLLRQISPMRLITSWILDWTGPHESGSGWATTSLVGLNRRRSDPLGLVDAGMSSSSSGGRLLFGCVGRAY